MCCSREAVTIEKIEKNKMNRVECPDCNYKMPIFFSDKAEWSDGFLQREKLSLHF